MKHKSLLLTGLLVVLFSCALDAWTFHGPLGGPVDQFVFHPTNSRIVFLHEGSDFYSGYLYRSLNGGETWKRLELQPSAVRTHPKDPSGFYAVVGDTLFRSFDSGNKWIRVAKSPFGEDEIIRDFAIHPDNASILYVIADYHPHAGASENSAFYVSINGGKTWTRLNETLPQQVERMAVDPIDGNTVFFIGITGAETRLYKSINGGRNFTPSRFGHFLTTFLSIDPKDSRNIYIGGDLDFVKSTNAGKTFQPVNCNCSGQSLAIYPEQPSILYIAGNNGLMRSLNSGRSWTNIELPLTSFSFGPQSVAISPSSSNILFTGSGPIGFGIYKSLDGGATWKSRNRGLDARRIDRIRVNPSFQNNIFAIASGVLLHTLDGGNSWNRVAIFGVSSAEFIRRHPTNPQLILVANNVFGQFAISRNDGRSWRPNRFPFQYPSAIAFHPKQSSVIYAAGEQGLFRTDNNGNSWERLGDHAEEIISIEISPTNPQIILTLSVGYEKYSIFKSENGGKTFNLLNVPGNARQILINPQNDQILYAINNYVDNSIAKSIDGGNTWMEFGVPNNLGFVHIDPLHPDHLFAAQHFSLDGGQTWKNFDRNALSLAINEYVDIDLVPGRLYISTDRGIYSHRIPK